MKNRNDEKIDVEKCSAIINKQINVVRKDLCIYHCHFSGREMSVSQIVLFSTSVVFGLSCFI